MLQTQLADSKAKCRLLEESLRSLAHENGDQDAEANKAPKNIKRSPSSSIGGDVVVAGSSSNTTESDSSDFDEYYDTGKQYKTRKTLISLELEFFRTLYILLALRKRTFKLKQFKCFIISNYQVKLENSEFLIGGGK